MPRNTIVAAYTRHSTEKQDSKLQVAFIKQQLKHHKVKVDPTHFYEEGTMSATKKASLQDRKEGKKLHALVESGQVKTIFVYKLDRLFRKIWAAHAFVALCQNMGTDIISMDTPQGIICDDGFLLYSMGFMMAEMEARRLSRRTTDGMAANRKAGRSTTGAVWGWDTFVRLDAQLNPQSKVDPNWQEQSVIVWMKKRLDEGWSKNKIATALNDIGLRGKAGGKWQSGGITRTLESKQHQQLVNFNPPKRMMKWPFTALRNKQAKQFD